MKISQLRELLDEIARTAAEARHNAVEFGKLLEREENSDPISVFIKRLTSAGNGISAPDNPQDRGVDQLVGQFSHLEKVYNVGGAKGPAKDMAALLRALAPFAEWSVEDYVRAVLSVEIAPGRAASSELGANPAIVQSCVEGLKKSAGDKAKFDAVVERIKVDKRITGKVLTQIVNSFSGHEGSFKNKDAAYEWLENAFTENARFQLIVGR